MVKLVTNHSNGRYNCITAPIKVAWEYFWDKDIQSLKQGKINPEQFCASMKIRFSLNLSDNTPIYEAWNSMCVISEQALRQIKDFLDKSSIRNFKISIAGFTNETHYEFISAQVRTLGSQYSLSTGNCTTVLSYQEKQGNFSRLAQTALSRWDQHEHQIVSLASSIDTRDKAGLTKAEFSYCPLLNTKGGTLARVVERYCSGTSNQNYDASTR